MYCKDNRPHFETVVCCMYKYKWWPKRVCVVVCVCEHGILKTSRNVPKEVVLETKREPQIFLKLCVIHDMIMMFAKGWGCV